MKINELAEQIVSYNTSPITRELVEVILDFNILLEPDDQASLAGDMEFAENQQKWAGLITRGDAIVRLYGMRLPRNLKEMQFEFYSFTNSSKYRASAESISVARTVLSRAWDGLNDWRD